MNPSQKERFSEALARVAGDEDTLGMLATIAAEDAPDMMRELRREVADGDMPEVARTSHALKGLLSAFETKEPVSGLEALIEAARENDPVTVASLHQKIAPSLADLLEEIRQLAS